MDQHFHNVQQILKSKNLCKNKVLFIVNHFLIITYIYSGFVYLQVADAWIKHLICLKECFVYLRVANVQIKHLIVFKSVFGLNSSC